MNLAEHQLHMSVTLTVAIGLSLGCLLDCNAAGGGQSVSIRSLAKGAFSGIRDARQEIVKAADEWEKLWKQHAIPAGTTGKIPPVDFSKEMVIVATLGTKRTGGYSIEIVSAEARDKSLIITVKKSAPPPGAITVQALTAPYHFVAVRRSDLKAEFVESQEGGKK